ncbi:MAG: hypothetical protein ACYCPX_12720 [Acidiferrobacteraceae bacterium]
MSKKTIFELVLVLAILLVAWYLWDKTSAVVAKTAKAIDPFNNKNVFYTGLNTAIGGSSSWSLGSWIYDHTHNSAGGFSIH